jgi:hypothetical protein
MGEGERRKKNLNQENRKRGKRPEAGGGDDSILERKKDIARPFPAATCPVRRRLGGLSASLLMTCFVSS